MESAAVEVEGVEVTPDVEGPVAWASRFLWSVAAGLTSFGGVVSGVGTSMFFPDLNVMALTFLEFFTVCDALLWNYVPQYYALFYHEMTFLKIENKVRLDAPI